MSAAPSDERLRRLRLAAQRLTAATVAADAQTAARAVVGVQAQDVRAAGLALRSRVASLARADVDGSGLVRTWTVRGTVHLVAPDDLPWLDAVTGPRNRTRFDAAMAGRGGRDRAVAMLDDVGAVLADGPLDRPALLRELALRGHPPLPPPAVNVLMPWAAAHGHVIGLPDGRYRAAQPPPTVDADQALATLGRRYLSGYGPASATDLAHWSGLPLGTARRAFAALGELETAGDLVALPGTLDAEFPPAPAALLLAAFDTAMLGYRTRELLVPPEYGRRVLPGGGMLRPVVLVDGIAAGTWGLTGSGSHRAVGVEWFAEPVESSALDAEKGAVEHYLRAS